MAPETLHVYESSCVLRSPLGFMEGTIRSSAPPARSFGSPSQGSTSRLHGVPEMVLNRR